MLPLLEFSAGIHTCPRTGLRFHLHAPLALPPSSHLILAGTNGVGKTTFLERILIPTLRPKHAMVYLAQDMDLQRTTMAVTLALLHLDVPNALPQLALAWIQASKCQDIFIMDEFDKYLRADQYAALPVQNFSWVITISHLHSAQFTSRAQHGFKLTLQRKPDQLDVDMHLEQLW